MRIVDEDGEVADAKVTGPCCKDVALGECAEGGVAARAAATNRQAPAISESALYKIFRSVGTIINVDDSPLSIEALAIGTTIASAATVIDIDEGKATAGPELDISIERAANRCRGATVREHQERW